MGRSEAPRRWLQPWLLWLLTLCLWLPGLGNLPLRDWDEGRVATVARSTTTLLPQKWSDDYLNKPPGLHLPMGQLIRHVSDDETMVRLLPTVLASLAIPLITLLRRSLGGDASKQKAVLSALVLMTLLPMARHGRLAMLDGSLVSCTLLLWWGWLGAATTPMRALAAGLAGSGVLLLKPPALLGFGLIAVLVGGRSCWPSPRSWVGLTLGLVPGLTWHLWHWSVRGDDALLMWGGQGLARITSSVGDGHGWWTPWAELLEGGWPWCLLLPAGLIWAWRHRHQRAGRWELGLLLGSAAMVLPLRTQLPWYSHLLWPPIALLCGEGVHQLLDQRRPRWVTWSWQGLGLLLGLGGSALLMINSSISPSILLSAGFGLLLGGWMLRSATLQARQRGLMILLIGWSLALLAFWQSRLWIWELNESWDPRPIAAQIRLLDMDADVQLKGPTRPSLGWYAQRELKRYRKGDRPEGEHWVVSDRAIPDCRPIPVEHQSNWRLWHCE